MNDSLLAGKMESTRQRFEELCLQLQSSPDRQQILSETMQEFSNTLEELNVAMEELRQQNDELVTTRSLVEEERRHYQSLFEFAPDGYLVTDIKGTITELNGHAATLLNLPARFAVGKPMIVSISNKEHGRFRQLLTALAKGDDVPNWETEIQPRHGSPFPATLTVSRLPNTKTGGALPGGLRWIVRDITARKAAELQAINQLRRISVLRDINVAITSSLDLDTILNILLDQLALLFPFPSAATVRLIAPQSGKLEHVICRGIDPAEWNAHAPASPSFRTQEVLRSNASVAVRNIKTDPHRHTPDFYIEKGMVSYLGAPLNIQGEILGILCLYTREEHEFSKDEIDSFSALAVQAAMAIHNSQLYQQVGNQAAELERARDDLELRVEERTHQLAEANAVLKAEIGERQSAEEKLRESERRLSAIASELEEQLIASDRLVSIGELAASIAHEFNNPLQIILGFAQDLATEPDLPQGGRQNLQIIEEEVLRCREMIRNLLDFSRPRNLQLEAAVVEPILRESIKLVRSHLEKSNVSVEIDVPSDLPRIHGDPQQLKQVLINLFFNAAEAMPRGGTLAIRAVGSPAQAGGNELVVTVSDTGTGISPESMANIFRPFFTTKKKRGTGLGLSVCDRIMRAHGGSVSVESKQGVGTTFYLRFPLTEARSDEGIA